MQAAGLPIDRVSIHAPVKGRLEKKSVELSNGVSIHAPVKGRLTHHSATTDVDGFNPRPREGATIGDPLIRLHAVFQSTPP